MKMIIRNLKFILKVIVTLVCTAHFLFGSVSAYSEKIHFSDISTHWAREYIESAAELGLVDGIDHELFCPDEDVTNAQLISMLIRASIGTIDPINDYWYSGYMDYAINNMIITDMELNNADKPITRQSAARIVHEILCNVYNEQDEDNWEAAESLADLYECSTCVMHIAQVYVKGIMTGRGDGMFHLTDNLTRAEAVTIVMRVIKPSLRIVIDKNSNSVSEISKDCADKLINNGALIIDVRPANLYAQGHIRGSISIPIENILSDPISAFSELDKNSIILVYCSKGTNSRRASLILCEAGYTNVYNLGGIDNGNYDLTTDQ